jgi:hypothetical protein
MRQKLAIRILSISSTHSEQTSFLHPFSWQM